MTAKRAFAALAALLAFALAGVWNLTAERRANALENRAQLAIARRDVFVSPAELATLMHSRRVALAIFDLRDEMSFNQFHLADAKRLVSLPEVRELPDKTIKLLVAADEASEARAFRTLARLGTKQLYVLAGGMPSWLALFAPDGPGALALGARHGASYPDLTQVALPKYEPKVKLGLTGAKKGPGGCGG